MNDKEKALRYAISNILDRAMGYCRTYPTGGTTTRDMYVEEIISEIKRNESLYQKNDMGDKNENR